MKKVTVEDLAPAEQLFVCNCDLDALCTAELEQLKGIGDLLHELGEKAGVEGDAEELAITRRAVVTLGDFATQAAAGLAAKLEAAGEWYRAAGIHDQLRARESGAARRR